MCPTGTCIWRAVDGAPAGAAVLSIHGDIGYLAAGSVLPQFRGRGVHAALIAARSRFAAARGTCRIVTVGTRRGDRRASAICSAPVSRSRT